ncbi:MAG TPA: hypothetical protein VM598_04750 [Bdellovibrionota bacterium]|nr:hypothetical protein [Bdellovibrionota bacterium]
MAAHLAPAVARADANQFPALLMSARELAELHEKAGLRYILDTDQLLRRALRVPAPILSSGNKGFGAEDRELRGIFDPVIRSRLTGEGTAICRIYGEDCLTIAYLDDSERIHRRQADEEFPFHVGEQLELAGFLDLESLIAEVQGYTRPRSRKPLDYRGPFRKAKYFDVPKRAESDWDLIEPEWRKLLKTDGASAESFTSLLLKSSRVFNTLPALHAEAAKLGRTGALRAVERAYEKALFLTLDALYANADYRSATYPYRRESDTASDPASLLGPSALASHLSPLGRWPELRSLTLAVREEKARRDPESVFLLKTRRGTWSIRGFYSTGVSSRCQDECPKIPLIHVDYDLPFFENVFLLYHELWHVAWDQSSLGEKRVSQLVETLRAASVDEARVAILRYISENELIAIDQQNRLFHANEFLASEWEGNHLYTAKGWHDSYFGIRSRYEKLGGYQIRGGLPNWLFRVELGPLGVIPVALVQGVRKLFEGAQAILRGTEDPNYWSDRLRYHREHFEDVYLCKRSETLDLTAIQTAVRMSELKFVERKVPVLGCAELLNAARAIEGIQCGGKRWITSLPFDYRVVDDGSAACQELRSLPTGFLWLGGGNGGTHGGFDFMASMDHEVSGK